MDSQGHHTVTELHRENRGLVRSYISLVFSTSINKIIMADNKVPTP